MLSVPHLIKTKGNIINVSSINGMRAVCSAINTSSFKMGVAQVLNGETPDLN